LKLLRLKITDPDGIRSLPCGFEHHFRTEITLEKELENGNRFAPFVCAGPNGSGKSNLLEVLAAIFFQLEILRVRRSFLPEALQSDELDFSPKAFELDYLIKIKPEYQITDGSEWAKVKINKKCGESIEIKWENQNEFSLNTDNASESAYLDIILPEYILGYSSGENEILSLPFFKMRFVEFDEYHNALKQQLPYPGHPETRLAYLDNSFSQAILICNLLFQNKDILKPFRDDVGIDALKEFRIIIKRSIPINQKQLAEFDLESEDKRTQQINEFKARQSDENLLDLLEYRRSLIVKDNPALFTVEDENGDTRYKLNLMHKLEGYDESSLAVSALKRCATLSYHDEASDTLMLDYWVNEATKQAFSKNFSNSPLELFQALRTLLSLNLYAVSDSIKDDVYKSSSHYVSETIPTLASDQRIMHFKFVRFSKQGVENPMMLKELSDGEHQFLHSLGLSILFRDTNSLFLLDEPETHFNPNWRANFISRLRQCLPGKEDVAQEMLISTHTPFLISDSTVEKVMVFNKDDDHKVSITQPDYNTLGASINKITMKTFLKGETIGGYAQSILKELRDRFNSGEESEALVNEINNKLGDSIEKILLLEEIENNKKGNH
jgi:restriction system-associated AAA family ATPase